MSIKYRLFETKGYQSDLEETRKTQGEWLLQKLIIQVYPQIREEPHYGPNIKKMKSVRPTVWRYRIGTFRLFYHIDEDRKFVFLDTIEHRKEAYR